MIPPVDWVLTITDHGPQVLVEIREGGRLTARKWMTPDDLVCDGGLAFLISQNRSQRWRQERR